MLVPGGSPLPTLRVLPQGISRKRLEQAVRDLQLPVVIARDVDEADVVMTLKNEYKQKTPMLRDAEDRAMPIYVLKSNTMQQMQASLTSIFSLEIDPREAAMRETEDAIEVVLTSSEAVELAPQNAYIRRLQHQMAERANLVSRSRGREPYRRVRLYPDAARSYLAVIEGLTLDFVGHSCVVIDIDGVRIVTDPVTRARVGPLQRVVPVPAKSRLADVDLVLISHLHWDHLDLPSLKRIAPGTPIVVPAGAGRLAPPLRVPVVRELAIGETTEVGGIRIDGVPANHSGFRPPRGPTAPAMGFVIQGTTCVYFAGDTDMFEQMSTCRDRGSTWR